MTCCKTKSSDMMRDTGSTPESSCTMSQTHAMESPCAYSFSSPNSFLAHSFELPIIFGVLAVSFLFILSLFIIILA